MPLIRRHFELYWWSCEYLKVGGRRARQTRKWLAKWSWPLAPWLLERDGTSWLLNSHQLYGIIVTFLMICSSWDGPGAILCSFAPKMSACGSTQTPEPISSEDVSVIHKWTESEMSRGVHPWIRRSEPSSWWGTIGHPMNYQWHVQPFKVPVSQDSIWPADGTSAGIWLS